MTKLFQNSNKKISTVKDYFDEHNPTESINRGPVDSLMVFKNF